MIVIMVTTIIIISRATLRDPLLLDGECQRRRRGEPSLEMDGETIPVCVRRPSGSLFSPKSRMQPNDPWSTVALAI